MSRWRLSEPTVAMTCRGGMSCAGCEPSCAEMGGCARSPLSRSTWPVPPSWPPASWAAHQVSAGRAALPPDAGGALLRRGAVCGARGQQPAHRRARWLGACRRRGGADPRHTARRGPPACRWSVRRRPRSARGCGRFGAGHRPRPRRGSCRDRGGANGADRAWAPDRRRSGAGRLPSRPGPGSGLRRGALAPPPTTHRTIATELAERSTAAAIVAEHWLAGREFEQGRGALLAAADASCAVHAYAMPRAHCSEPLSSGQRMAPRSSGWQPLTGSARVRNGRETWLERCEPGTRPLPAFARLGISGGGRD